MECKCTNDVNEIIKEMELIDTLWNVNIVKL